MLEELQVEADCVVHVEARELVDVGVLFAGESADSLDSVEVDGEVLKVAEGEALGRHDFGLREDSGEVTPAICKTNKKGSYFLMEQIG